MSNSVEMVPRLVVLSGPVGAGKSTLARGLMAKYGAKYVRTQELLRDHAEMHDHELPAERRALQDYGDHLDKTTAGRWVVENVSHILAEEESAPNLLIIDSVRRLSQLDALREVFTGRVVHIHVTAPAVSLEERYLQRGSASGLAELASYEQVAENSTEREVHVLAADADISIDTSRNTPEDVLTRATAALQLLPSRAHALVDVLIGGQYGSEGKGNIAYYMANEYQVLMRVGGPNAGHKVPTEPVYTHRLLPSGTLANPTAILVIGPGATLDLLQLLTEIADCGVEQGRLFVDPQVMIIESEDVAAEQELVRGIGSTGKGGGAAAARRIMGRHGGEPRVRLARDVPELEPWLRPTAEVLEDAFRSGLRILLEGTQGTALSIYHGVYPWVTSRDTTTSGCLAEAGIAPSRVRKVIMVCRTYPIRVMSPDGSTSGPMRQDLEWSEIAARSGTPLETLNKTEVGSVSNNRRRVAEFDWSLLRRAAELNGATDIALTFTDYLDFRNQLARRYEQLQPATIQFIEEVEKVAGAPVSLIGTCFAARSVIDRRRW